MLSMIPIKEYLLYGMSSCYIAESQLTFVEF